MWRRYAPRESSELGVRDAVRSVLATRRGGHVSYSRCKEGWDGFLGLPKRSERRAYRICLGRGLGMNNSCGTRRYSTAIALVLISCVNSGGPDPRHCLWLGTDDIYGSATDGCRNVYY